MEMYSIVEQAVRVLSSGGVIVYPTDTIWGIGCDATNSSAVEKVCAVKKRNPGKSMLVLCSDFEQVMEYVTDFDEGIIAFVEKQERPTTVVYPKATNLPANLVASDGSIGIRVPRSAFCRTLIEKFGKPIVSTSANFSGQKPPAAFVDIDARLLEMADFVVPADCNDSDTGKSSQIVKIDKNGEKTLLR